MKRQLLMMTKFTFEDETYPHRFELWREERFILEEWLVIDKENSVLVTQRHRDTDWDKAIESYGRFVKKHGMSKPGAGWLGVAITQKVSERNRQYLYRKGHNIVVDALYAGISACPCENEVLIRIFPAKFRTTLPRGIIGDGCWQVQFEGLAACRDCQYSGQKMCAGESTVETMTNSLGLDIPIV